MPQGFTRTLTGGRKQEKGSDQSQKVRGDEELSYGELGLHGLKGSMNLRAGPRYFRQQVFLYEAIT